MFVSLSAVEERDFESVRVDLENVVARLRMNDLDPDERRTLLRQLRILLEEVDQLSSANYGPRDSNTHQKT